MRKISSHALKIILMPLFIITNTNFFWFLIEKINHFFDFPIKSFFIYYSPNERSTSMFYYKWFHLNPKRKWKLMFCGIHRQDAGWGLNFFLNIDEKELTDEKNNLKLQQTINFINNLKDKIGIKYTNYAGIFPSIAKKRGYKIYNSSTENHVSDIVYQAYQKILNLEKLQQNYEVIILGGRGLIGKCLVNNFKSNNIEPIIIDILDSDKLIEKLTNKKHKYIIINVSRQKVIEKFDELFSDNEIILNEVFPPPKLKNINYFYHIKGFKSQSYPSLFSAYKDSYNGCMPCCAMISEENIHPEVIISKIK